MEYNISRRHFMQGAGVVALSIACSGMLTGCGDSMDSATTVKVGDYKVCIGDVGIKVSSDSKTAYFTPEVKFERTSTKGKTIKYSSLFAAYIGDTELSLENGSEEVDLKQGWVRNHKKDTAEPKFKTTSDQYTSLLNGETVKLYVMPYGKDEKQKAKAVYTINLNGNVTSSDVV